MNIKKTMLLAVSAAALVAFAVPAVAQATSLTDPPGTALKKGALVTATSTNLETTTPEGAALFCKKVTIHGEVTNAGGPGKSVTILPSATTTENCEITGVGPVLITEPSVGLITLGGAGSGSAAATFIADIPQSCHFAGTVAFSWTSGTDTLTVPGSRLTGTGSECPSEGTIAGSFTLETSNGTPVLIDT